jgi:hypothetical protein
MIRTGVVASAAAVALAACGGSHGVVPSTAFMPSMLSKSTAPTTCPANPPQPAWIFKGSCVISKLPTKGRKFTLAAYKGFAVTVTIPKNTATGNPAFVLVDAVGGKTKDIAPYKGKAFPPISTSRGKSVINIEAVNAFPGLKFTGGSLIVSVTAQKLPGNTCTVAVIQQKGTKFSWFSIPILPSVKGNVITEKIAGGAVGTLFPSGLPAGPLFFNAACK